MAPEIQDKLTKILELVNSGATEGERQAATLALNRIMLKYNISEEALKSIDQKNYTFGCCTWMEEQLLIHIMKMQSESMFSSAAKGSKKVYIPLTYMQYVDIDCRYEYYRRHLKQQWKTLCEPQLKKCRKPKTKNLLRSKLQMIFITQYLIKSGLVKPENIVKVESKNDAEYKQRMLCADVEGGLYNKQVLTTNLLENLL